MGAQKVILKELETQFGGSAEAAGKTFGGQINIVKQSLSNMAGEVVGNAMPKLMDLGTWIVGSGLPKLQSFAKGVSGNESVKAAFSALSSFWTDSFKPALEAVGTLFGSVLRAVKRVLEDKKEELATIFSGIAAAAKVIATVYTEVIVPALRLVFAKGGPFDIVFGLAIKIVAGLVTTISGIVSAVKDSITAVQKFWNGDGGAAFRSVFDAMADAIQPVRTAFDAIVNAVKWLIENLRKIPSIPGFSAGSASTAGKGVNPHGDGGAGVNLMGASPVMAPFAAAAAGYGLGVTSGLRPGAITANGTPSDHAIGKAIDVAGPAAGMAAFFKSLIGNRSVKQAFYDPLGSIFSGAWNSYREGGHSDHVHVATFDQGGILRPGLTLAYNGTGQNEYVSRGGGVTVNVAGSVITQGELENVIVDAIRRARNKGRPV